MSRRFLTYDMVFPHVLGLFLLIAVGLKCHSLSTEAMMGRDFWDTRWFWSSLIEIELAFALWLFSGLYSRAARVLLLIIFAVFFEFNLYQGFKGAPSCGCLGKVVVPPWWMAPLDVLIMAALIMWRPFERHTPVSSRSLAIMVSFWLTIGIPIWFAANHYHPGGPHRDLRQDRRLGVQVSLMANHPSQNELLELLHIVTGLNLSIADELLGAPPDYGSIQTMTVPAVAVMEWMAQKQDKAARGIASNWVVCGRWLDGQPRCPG